MKIGILGGGQLGRMLALAGMPLGLQFRFLAPPSEAVHGLGECVTELDPFCEGLSAATYEFENIPVEMARAVAARVPLFPSPRALEVSQDRLVEKRFFQRLEIPVTDFHPVDGPQDLSFPSLLKTRRLGYDGKGQWRLTQPSDAPGDLTGLIWERPVPFERELTVLAVRGRDGSFASYPLVETVHRQGILHTARPTASGPWDLAQSYALRILENLDYVGVLALELFEVEGRLLANEMAPRVHNAGHWTQDGAVTSQFENHLRAGLGLPLGSCAATAPITTLNLIGTLPDPAPLLAEPGLHLHLYGKSPRPGRKLGHLNLPPAALERIEGLLRKGSAASGQR